MAAPPPQAAELSTPQSEIAEGVQEAASQFAMFRFDLCIFRKRVDRVLGIMTPADTTELAARGYLSEPYKPTKERKELEEQGAWLHIRLHGYLSQVEAGRKGEDDDALKKFCDTFYLPLKREGDAFDAKWKAFQDGAKKS